MRRGKWPITELPSAPSIDIDKLRGWKDGIVKKLTGGLAGLRSSARSRS